MTTLHLTEPKPETAQISTGSCLLPPAYCLLLLPPSAADEMNNLDPVAIRKNRRWPFVTAHDLLIQLDRHTFRRQRQFIYQRA
ncbi:MAG TPA: hypothetical protein VHE60_07550 [Pyrinomonadaceae bacterium]|nr:hypothetical protein [Pyrinomonadaceae bacterium]